MGNRGIERAFGELAKERKRFQQQKGANNEGRVSLALDELTQESRIISHWPATYPQDRLEGTDRFILTNLGDKIPLQVKSSLAGMRKALEKYPNIPCLIVEESDDLEKIKQKITELLATYST